METGNSFLLKGLNNLTLIIRQNNIYDIFLTGDILTHNFDNQYYKYVVKEYKTQENLTNFSLKASSYVLSQIKSATNNAKIFYILGNNDGDQPDYVTPSPKFLNSIAKVLSKELSPLEQKIFEQDFSSAGYFSLALNKKTLVIGINTNLLSAVHPDARLATIQLKWLDKTLAMAQEHNQHVILLQHIPYGADFYKSAVNKTSIILMDTKLQAQYIKVLNKYNNISGIYSGHFHADYFELISDKKISLVSTISFNSQFGNNPGFKVLNLDENGLLYNYTTYYADLTNNKKLAWKIEYQLSSVYPGNIHNIIKNIPVRSQSNFFYRTFYNGSSKKYPAPITRDSNWAYYACAIMNINKDNYSKCLFDKRFNGQLEGYFIDYFITLIDRMFLFGPIKEYLTLL
jgi:hypothetical protein